MSTNRHESTGSCQEQQPGCTECRSIRNDIVELKSFVTNCFDNFARRFEVQDQKLTFVVKTLAEISGTPTTDVEFGAESKDDNQVQANDFSSLQSSDQQKKEDENDDDDDAEDVKPDVNLLREMVKKSVEVEHFTPSAGLQADNSLKKKLHDAVETRTKRIVVVQRQKTDNAKPLIITNLKELNSKLLINPPQVDPSPPSANATPKTGLVHPLPITPLGAVYRQPLSTDAVKRLITSELNRNRLISKRHYAACRQMGDDVDVDDSPTPIQSQFFRRPSEQAQRRLAIMNASLEKRRRLDDEAARSLEATNLASSKQRLSLIMTSVGDKKEKHGRRKRQQSSDYDGQQNNDDESVAEPGISVATNEDSGGSSNGDEKSGIILIFDCRYCDETFVLKKDRDIHYETHFLTENDRYQCKMCSMNYNRFNNLNRHMRAVHDADLRF